MAESLKDAFSHGWQPQDVRFVLLSEAVMAVFETAFWHAFGESSDARG
jgi:hypothetical protein